VIGDGTSLKNRLDFLQARDMSDENIKKVNHMDAADKENNNRNRSKSANKQSKKLDDMKDQVLKHLDLTNDSSTKLSTHLAQ
jgi:hypothetical protein